MTGGTLFVVGLGPGDPELMTLKAARVVAAAPVVAYFAKCGQRGHARTIVEGRMGAGAEELRLEYPYTTEIPPDDPRYRAALGAFYAGAAARIADRLAGGANVALLCEGDPFLYGSALALYDRLHEAWRCEVVPGVSGMSGCWTRAGVPMAHGDDVLSVLPGTLPEAQLAERLGGCDAAVIIKAGRHLDKIRAALGCAERGERAVYVERGTMAGERVLPLAAVDAARAPYFSLVLVPGRRRAR